MKHPKGTLLVVEDDPDDQLLIRRALTKVGATGPIRLVSSGEEAIKYMMGEGKFSNRKEYAYPTFIITDLKMSPGDGFSVLEFLKANLEWAVIPTVVFSASTDLDDIKRSYLLGASSYHVKPNTTEALVRQLSILNDYWQTCEVPAVDGSGKRLATCSEGKLGERFGKQGQPVEGAEIKRPAEGGK